MIGKMSKVIYTYRDIHRPNVSSIRRRCAKTVPEPCRSRAVAALQIGTCSLLPRRTSGVAKGVARGCPAQVGRSCSKRPTRSQICGKWHITLKFAECDGRTPPCEGSEFAPPSHTGGCLTPGQLSTCSQPLEGAWSCMQDAHFQGRGAECRAQRGRAHPGESEMRERQKRGRCHCHCALQKREMDSVTHTLHLLSKSHSHCMSVTVSGKIAMSSSLSEVGRERRVGHVLKRGKRGRVKRCRMWEKG